MRFADFSRHHCRHRLGRFSLPTSIIQPSGWGFLLPRPSFISARLAADDEFCLAALSFAGDNADCELLVGWEGRVTVFLSFDAFLPSRDRWILLSWNEGWLGLREGCGKFSVNFGLILPFRRNDHFKLRKIKIQILLPILLEPVNYHPITRAIILYLIYVS